MLIATDDALKSAAEIRPSYMSYHGDNTYKRLDEKFGKAIRLLGSFEKEFSYKHLTSDPNTGGTRSPSTILRALEKNLHAKVKFLFVSLPLNSDEP